MKLAQQSPLKARPCPGRDDLGHRTLDDVLVRRALWEDRRTADTCDLLGLLRDRLRGHEQKRVLLDRRRGPTRRLLLVLGQVHPLGELLDVCGHTRAVTQHRVSRAGAVSAQAIMGGRVAGGKMTYWSTRSRRWSSRASARPCAPSTYRDTPGKHISILNLFRVCRKGRGVAWGPLRRAQAHEGRCEGRIRTCAEGDHQARVVTGLAFGPRGKSGTVPLGSCGPRLSHSKKRVERGDRVQRCSDRP